MRTFARTLMGVRANSVFKRPRTHAPMRYRVPVRHCVKMSSQDRSTDLDMCQSTDAPIRRYAILFDTPISQCAARLIHNCADAQINVYTYAPICRFSDALIGRSVDWTTALMGRRAAEPIDRYGDPPIAGSVDS